jgi:hypothetical protein
MATVANDIDRILNANPAPAEPAPADRELLVLCSSPGGFKVSTGGLVTPSSITFDAVPLAMPGGVVAWSATGGTITTAGNRATLTSANATSDAITVTATITFEGVTYTRVTTIQKVYDGAKGDAGNPGTSPNKNGIAFLYKWSTSAPTKPAGSSTFTWAGGANTAYGGADGWSITVPANPGTPLIQLFVASIAVTDAAAATTTSVGYASSTVAAWAQNGSNGSNGSNGATGVQSGEALLYQWAATIPAGPVGSPTFIWSTGLFGAAPATWSLTPGTAPSPGMTLWQARVGITDSAANTQTAFNWSAASILAVGYAGTNGTGTTGAEGVSYVTAYCASATATTNTAPANTIGRNSYPAVNGGGITGTWSKSVPALSSGQFMYQSDGLYNPANDTVTWSIPYWSSLKVGTLSAISANLGAITGGSIDIGSGATSWHVDATGNQWAGAAGYGSAPFRVSNAGAVTATNATLTGALMGGAFTGWAWPANNGVGFYVGPNGAMWGNPSINKFFSIDSGTGNVNSPQFQIVNGLANFSGGLSAPSGTLGALSIPTGGYIAGGAFTGWAWPASGGGFVLESRGLLIGNKTSGTTGYFEVLADGTIGAPGFSLANKQLTLTSPVIINPNFGGDNRAVWIDSSGGNSFTHPRTVSSGYCGTHTAHITNPVNPTYTWSIFDGYPQAAFTLSGTTGPSVTVRVTGTGAAPGDSVSCTLTCTISDSGVTKSTELEIFVYLQ